jgi:hypothetical protein
LTAVICLTEYFSFFNIFERISIIILLSNYSQMFCRFSNWLSSGLDARKTGNTSSNSGYEWAASAVPSDFLYVSVMS